MASNRRTCPTLLLILILLAGCSAPPAQTGSEISPGWTLAVEPLPSPASASSSGVQLTAEGAQPILSWLEFTDAATVLKFAERTGSGWSEPRVVASGDDFYVTDADAPSVRALPDGTLVAHWQQADGLDDEAYKLPVSSSKDQGRTWSTPTTPNHDKAPAQHGFASLFQAPGAGLGVIWLDGRNLDPKRPGDSSMELWAATYDRNGRQVSERAIDTRVCDCCQTAVAATAEGVVVAYRDRSAEEVRDIYVTRFDGAEWSAPVPVHADGWVIHGCPVNGPAIDARLRDVTVAWFTARGDQGQALAAFSRDGGHTFGQPVRIDDAGSLGQVDVTLLADGSAVVSWIESGTERPQLKARRVEQNGTRSPAVTLTEKAGIRNPRLARNGDELLFAWVEATDAGSSPVKTARASLAGLAAR